MLSPSRKSYGFTLIELMISVAVVAILAAIAIPSYTEYVRRAHLTDGQKALASAAIELEQVFADRRAYPITADFTPTSTAFIGIIYGPSADRRSFILNGSGSGKLVTYFLAQTSAGARCKCEKCSSDPMATLAPTATSCPAGASPW